MQDNILSVLQDLKSSQTELMQLTLLSCKKALTTQDAALLLGLSRSHVYKLVHRKEIPYYKSAGGKITYFDRSELDKWMLSCRVRTNDELDGEVATSIVTGKKGKK